MLFEAQFVIMVGSTAKQNKTSSSEEGCDNGRGSYVLNNGLLSALARRESNVPVNFVLCILQFLGHVDFRRKRSVESPTFTMVHQRR